MSDILPFAAPPPPPRLYEPPDEPPRPGAGSAAVRKLTRSPDLGDSPRPNEPCAAFPGTPEKIEVMRARVQARRSAFHEGDLSQADARWLGFVCSTDANGATQWLRPVDEWARRALIVSAQAALRALKAV